MDSKEWRRFVLEGSRTGKLATVRPNGKPHVVPIWFVMEGDTIVFSSGETTVKTKNIRATPYASLCVDLESFPYAFVMFDCEARIEHLAAEALVEYTTEIARRYVPEERAVEYGKRNGVATEVLIRLTPQKVIPWGGMSD